MEAAPKNTKRVLIIPDAHHPYHCKKAWNLLLLVAKNIPFDTVITLGDFADFFPLFSGNKNPNKNLCFKRDLDKANSALDQLDALKIENKVFLAGNHEERLERYLMSKAPELFNSLKINEIFRLKQRGWKYVAYRDYTSLGRFHFTHDLESAGRNAVLRNLDRFQHNIVCGHTHRLHYVVEGNARGDRHVSATFGWLGDVEQIDYKHRALARREWSQGFGMLYLNKDGTGILNPVPIVNRSCIVEGVKYSV